MGIDDRPYLRSTPPSRGGFGRGQAGGGRIRLPMWSVTTWLIVLCTSIFVIDGFLPIRHVPTGNVTLRQGVNPDRIDMSQLRRGEEQRDKVQVRARTGQMVEIEVVRRQMVLGPDRTVVGFEETRPMRRIESYLYFSTDRLVNGIEYWRVLGFQFLHSHASLAHLLFNMLGLFFFGPMVERHLGSKRYLAFYLLCGIAGAMMYLFLNVLGIGVHSFFGPGVRIPGLIFNDMSTPLIGASAGVFGILMAGAFLAPNATVLLFFVIPMRLATLAYALVILSLLSVLLAWSNAGGDAAHIGGAIAGWYLIRNPAKLHGFFDVLGRFDPTSRSNRARRTRKVQSKPHPPDEIDRILDKISNEGIHSLSASERKALREASGRD